MIRVRRPPDIAALKSSTRSALAKRQAKASGFTAGDSTISKAWKTFLQSKPKTDVADALDRCFRFKCAYCEGVAAQDIEHFYPKTLYPDRMFTWTNFLRGCKNCNNFKRGQFPLNQGQPVLLDPCQDDPLDYFVWDFQTGAIGVRPKIPYQTRGNTTRDLLRLDQEPLREERRKKLALVLYLLAQIIRENPLTDETRLRLQEELAPQRPWPGIVRQLFRRPGKKYQPLVRAARQKVPEIEQWTDAWL